MLLVTIAFLSGLAFDLLWVRCVALSQDQRALAAANVALALYVCQAVATVLIIEQCFLACAAYAAGSWAGTYLGVSRWRK